MIGLLIASMIAAMMSSLSSVFNSASTIFTVDIYQRFINPSAEEKKLILVGRMATIGCVLLGVLWIPVIQSQSGQLFLITQKECASVTIALT